MNWQNNCQHRTTTPVYDQDPLLYLLWTVFPSFLSFSRCFSNISFFLFTGAAVDCRLLSSKKLPLVEQFPKKQILDIAWRFQRKTSVWRALSSCPVIGRTRGSTGNLATNSSPLTMLYKNMSRLNCGLRKWGQVFIGPIFIDCLWSDSTCEKQQERRWSSIFPREILFE